MLLIQHIKIYWNKSHRGTPYATDRARMPQAYPLPANFFDEHPRGYPIHLVYLEQQQDGLRERRNDIQTLKKYNPLRVGAIEAITQEEDHYEIRYRYDGHRGANPARTRYDVHTNTNIPLNERAMILQPGECGRICYNGRYTDYDTGEWYYNLDIINLIHLGDQPKSLRPFTKKPPDKTYQQMARLH
ncbi:hypothetical protein [Paenibacillus tyrfis]|uniref:hypothetical protein n=1 Tax=Paenibacillus tyrfis TaxID=1501230 RepID=UPI000B594E9C|nr:hypothetical protein [Paenibacillus tyrfis]